MPQAITDVMGGAVSFTFADLGNALAQQKGGKLTRLAVTSEKRSSLAPEVPAIAEELQGYELIAWFALMAPANTPRDIVAKLHDAAGRASPKRNVKEKFAAIGTDVGA
jgi:tripartite-type tricarboxylate transporter receptor subunit TctC